MNTGDNKRAYFKNNTGARVKILGERLSGIATVTGIVKSYKNTIVEDTKSVTYDLKTTANSKKLPQLREYGGQLHIDYELVDSAGKSFNPRQKSTHTIAVFHSNVPATNMPASIQVNFAFCQGLPRTHKLFIQGTTNKYNGSHWYQSSCGKVKLYSEYHSSDTAARAGSSGKSTYLAWYLEYHGEKIARHQSYLTTSRTANLNVKPEDIHWSFPLDCSYYGNINLSSTSWHEPTYTTNMYRTWTDYGTPSFSSGESDLDNRPGSSKLLRYLFIMYTDTKSFADMGESWANAYIKSNGIDAPLHIPSGGSDDSGGLNGWTPPSPTYELNALVTKTASYYNKHPRNVLFEWEVATESSSPDRRAKAGVGHRFVTQYSKFTVNLKDMGIFSWHNNTNKVWFRYRVLVAMKENRSGTLRRSAANEAKMGTWSTWKSGPRILANQRKSFKHAGKYWIGFELSTTTTHKTGAWNKSGNTQHGNFVETDCGWDGRLMVHVEGTGSNSKLNYWHPLVSLHGPGGRDSQIALGVNAKTGLPALGPGTWKVNLYWHRGIKPDDYTLPMTTSNGFIETFTVTTGGGSIAMNPMEAKRRDENLYIGYYNDGEKSYNGTGTFITGYECCETDGPTGGEFLFNIQTQKCSEFDPVEINRELNGAGKKGEMISKFNRGEMAYYDGKNVTDSMYNSYMSTVPGHGDVDMSGRSGTYLKMRTHAGNAYQGQACGTVRGSRSGIDLRTLGPFLTHVPSPGSGCDHHWGRTHTYEYIAKFRKDTPMTGLWHPNIEYTNIRGFTVGHMDPDPGVHGWHEGGDRHGDKTQWPWMGPGDFEKPYCGSRLGRVYMYDNGADLGHGRGKTFGGDHQAHLSGWSRFGDYRNYAQWINNGVAFDPKKSLKGAYMNSGHFKNSARWMESPYGTLGRAGTWFSLGTNKGTLGDSGARMSIWYENTHKTDSAILQFGVQSWCKGNDASLYSLGIYDDKLNKKFWGPGKLARHFSGNFPTWMDARGQAHAKMLTYGPTGSNHDMRWWLSPTVQRWGTWFLIPPGKRYRFCLLAGKGAGHGNGRQSEASGYRMWRAWHQGYRRPDGSIYDG